MASILCLRVSTGIRHNIAQFCQEPGVIAGQNNTCVPYKSPETHACDACTGAAATGAQCMHLARQVLCDQREEVAQLGVSLLECVTAISPAVSTLGPSAAPAPDGHLFRRG
jgi:hypothetical protein